MLKQASANVAALLINAGVGYVAYLLTVPAVVLQAATLVIGAGSGFAIALSSGPDWVNDVAVSALNALGLSHASYSGNPIPALLRWYFLGALALDVAGTIFARLFPSFLPRRARVFLAFTILDAIAFAFFATLFILDGRSALVVLVPFLITVLFTAVAFGANAVRRAVATALGPRP